EGTLSGLYDVDNTLQLMVFHWVFIPWLQEELNTYQGCVNLARKHHDCNKVLPHGRLELIHMSPKDFGALDFKVTVDPAAIQQVRNIYIKPDHLVFNLIPGPLNVFLCECCNKLGCPVVNRSSVWTVYCQLYAVIQCYAKTPPILASINTEMEDDELTLLDGLQDLPFLKSEIHYYMGNVGGGLGLSKYFIVLQAPCILLVGSSY
ncbi:hypothetical protein PAXRUDRAFT_162010, partial [Paxillus rubicundulus Ve08.2h10]